MPEHGLDDLDLRLDIGLMTVNICCRKYTRSSFNRLVKLIGVSAMVSDGHFLTNYY